MHTDTRIWGKSVQLQPARMARPSPDAQTYKKQKSDKQKQESSLTPWGSISQFFDMP
jgi:hypothetical protein